MTILDFIRIWYLTSQVSIDKIEVVDLAKLGVLKKTYLVDNTQVYGTNPTALDKISFDLFSDSRVLTERKTVEVINGTTTSGLGGGVARIIGNMGAQVLFVKTSDKKIDKSRILVSGESYTAKKISKSLGIPIVNDKAIEKTNILILIGEDY